MPKKEDSKKNVARKAAARPADTEGHAMAAKKGVVRRAASTKKDSTKR